MNEGKKALNFIVIYFLLALLVSWISEKIYRAEKHEVDGTIWRKITDFCASLIQKKQRNANLEREVRTKLLAGSLFWGKGWNKDFVFYESNNNPILAIAFCDPVHPISAYKHRLIFFATQAFGMWQTVLLLLQGLDPISSGWFMYVQGQIQVFLVAPELFFYSKILYYLYACPCLYKEGDPMNRKTCMHCIGRVVAFYWVLLPAVACVVKTVNIIGYGVVINEELVTVTFIGFVRGYFYYCVFSLLLWSPLWHVLVDFNTRMSIEFKRGSSVFTAVGRWKREAMLGGQHEESISQTTLKTYNIGNCFSIHYYRHKSNSNLVMQSNDTELGLLS